MQKTKKWAAELDLEKKGKEKKRKERKHEERIEIDLRKEKTKQASLASLKMPRECSVQPEDNGKLIP